MPYFIDAVEYENSSGEFKYRGESTMLSGLNTRVFNYFLENPNKIITYDELMDQVWKRIVTENAVIQVISQIRLTYKNVNPQTEIIKTLRGKGFQLNPDIKIIHKKSSEQRTHRNWAALFSVIAICFLVFIYWNSKTAENENANKRLLILMSTDHEKQEDDYTLATDTLLNQLLHLSDNNNVINLEKYNSAKEKHQTAQRLWGINPKLNLVTVSLNKENDQYVTSVEMIKGRTGTSKKSFVSNKLTNAILETAQWISHENTLQPINDNLDSLLPQNEYLMETYMRGLAKAKTGNHSQAISFFNLCLNEKSDFHLARLELAKSFSKKGEFESSQVELETLKSLNNNGQLMLAVDIEQASLALRRGDNKRGLALYNKIVMDKPVEPRYYLIHMNNMIAHYLVSDYDYALNGLLKLDQVMDAKVYPSYSAVTQYNIGRIYMEQQQITLAQSYYHESIKIFEQLNDLQRTGIAYSELSFFYKSIGQYDLANNASDQAFQIAKTQNNARSILWAYDSLIDLKIAQGLFDEAAELNQLLSDGAIESGSTYLQMRAAQWAGMIALQLNQLERAKIHINHMVVLTEELEVKSGIIGNQAMQLDLAIKSDHFKEAGRIINTLEKLDSNALIQSYFTDLKTEFLAKTSGPESVLAYLLARKNTVAKQNNPSLQEKIEIMIAEQHLLSDPKKTIELLHGLKVDDNNAHPYHWILARAYNQQGQLENALAQLNKAKLVYNQRWTIEMEQLYNQLISHTH